MKNNIPVIYWFFRTVWTLIHFIIVAMATAALLTWALTDNHALRIWETSKTNVLEVQQRVSNAIPWPWAIGDEKDGGSSEPNSEDGTSEIADTVETLRVQVERDLHVRREPTKHSDSLDILSGGSWAEADCKVEDGALVEKGPKAPSTRWVYVQELGYISDAYVLTDTDGLPNC